MQKNTKLGQFIQDAFSCRYLDVALGLNSNYTLRSSDVLTAFSAVYTGSSVGLELAFNYTLQRFSNITSR